MALAALAVLPAHAETPPPRPGAKQDAKAMENKLEESKAEERKLDKKMRDLESALKETKTKSVSLAKSIRKNETAMEKLEASMAELEASRAEIAANLEGDRKSMARLILALQRLRRVPPEALFAKPGAPLEAAQTAMLLGEIIPTLDHQAQDLKVKLEKLQEVSQKMAIEKEELLETAEQLKGEEKEMAGLLKEREGLYSQTSEDLKTKQLEVQQISAKAQNLRDLVGRLQRDREEKMARARLTAPEPGRYDDSGPLTPLPPSGEGQLPVSGVIKTRFDELDAIGAKSQGITIAGRSGGLVVAPMAGQVRFAGPFKKYGNIVIIEHQGGYHSLVAGLEKIDTVVERNVSAGEPIGSLRAGGDDGKSNLYYELRLDGKPVNPARKFAELG